MKKTSLIFNLLGVILCGMAAPAAADFCSPNCNDCCEWSVLDGKMTLGADWLYWKVQQDGIVAGTITTTDATATPPLTRTRKMHPNSKWNSGFRVNLGYELPCDCWDVNVCYTYMPSRSTVANFTATETETFGEFTTFTSKWNLTLNNVDLDIGRVVSFGECLKVRPHVGFRTTWFDQKFRSYGETVAETTTFAAGRTKETFEGYGVEAGIWTDYSLGCGVSLVGHFGGSVLYSKFKVRSHLDNGTSVTTDGTTTRTVTETITGSDTYYTATPSVDYFVGVQYADSFCDMLVRARIGFEQHVLFDTNRFLSAGNLSGQGLTLGLDVGF